MKKVKVAFSEDFLITREADEKSPVKKLYDILSKKNNVRIVCENAVGVEFIVTDEFTAEKTINDWVMEFVMYEYMIIPYDDTVTVTVSEYVEAQARNVALNTIDRLVGANEFKKLARELSKIAPGLIKHNAVEALTRQSYIFAINDGDGYTTYIKCLAMLLDEIGAIKLARPGSYAEFTIQPKTRDNINPFQAVEKFVINKPAESDFQLVSIDIRECLNSLQTPEFRSFLKLLDSRSRKIIYLFRVPFVEKEVLDNLSESIGDVLCVRSISIPPFTMLELERCAFNALESFHHQMTEDGWEVFRQRINEEKNDGRFYGINTVNKVVREIIYLKHLNNAETGADDSLIKGYQISALSHGVKAEKCGLDLLDEKIGMESVKKRIEEIVAQISVLHKNSTGLGSPCIHMRFVGNPGTGKTTAARIIGQVLREKGVLRNGNFFEYNGRDFCGQYIGETAPKTAAKCRDAYGSVLFIDEAYSLYNEGHRNTADYGREAIATLISEMENHRNDLVVIMAGYPDEMQTLMDANKGLESRMPYVIEFPNYTREQLFDIFMLMVEKNFKYKDGFKETAREFFLSLSDELINDKKFSNARFARNVFERTWGKAAMRAQLNEGDTLVLTKEDFILASTDKEFDMLEKPSKKGIGFNYN